MTYGDNLCTKWLEKTKFKKFMTKRIWRNEF